MSYLQVQGEAGGDLLQGGDGDAAAQLPVVAAGVEERRLSPEAEGGASAIPGAIGSSFMGQKRGGGGGLIIYRSDVVEVDRWSWPYPRRV